MRVIAARVDALTLGAQVRLTSDVAARLRSAAELAREYRVPVACQLGDVEVAVTPSRQIGRVHWATGDAHGVVDVDARPGQPNADVVLRQAALATARLQDSLERASAYLTRLGEVGEMVVRRVDLALDVEGWELRPGDAHAWVGPPRGRGVSHLALEPDGSIRARAWTRGEAVDGFMLCPGAPIVMRVYDKRRHLQVAGDEQMRAVEADIWASADVDPEQPVTRVEFQVRSEALRELGCRDPRRLSGRLDELWQYLVQKWCRLIMPDTSTRRRTADVDERWLLVRAWRWLAEREPARRVRVRAAASLRQALGCLRSWAARMGMLVRLGASVEQLARMPAHELATWIGSYVADLGALLAREGPRSLLGDAPPLPIACALALGHDGALARFALPAL